MVPRGLQAADTSDTIRLPLDVEMKIGGMPEDAPTIRNEITRIER
jgi:hypothetical protein